MMNQNALQQVNQEIYRKYPEFAGIKPAVQPGSTSKSGSPEQSYLLTYQVQATTADNHKMTRWLRVSVSPQGKILKVSTSR